MAYFFSASNKDHSGRGLTREELIEYVKSHGLKVIEAGYVDSPPWPSKKREIPRNVARHVIILSLARHVFDVLSGFERLTTLRRRAHMVYCFSVPPRATREERTRNVWERAMEDAYRTIQVVGGFMQRN